MKSVKIGILDPKVLNLLRTLADLDLIVIDKEPQINFLDVVSRIRSKSKLPLSSEEITEEVEKVRARRYKN